LSGGELYYDKKKFLVDLDQRASGEKVLLILLSNFLDAKWINNFQVKLCRHETCIIGVNFTIDLNQLKRKFTTQIMNILIIKVKQLIKNSLKFSKKKYTTTSS